MSEETEGDMAAAELAAEAERDNAPAPLPPCGPERNVHAAIRAERDATRTRVIREAVEKMPGIGAPEADFVAVEWVTEAGRYPYRVAMPRAALLDALLGTDGPERVSSL